MFYLVAGSAKIPIAFVGCENFGKARVTSAWEDAINVIIE